MFSYEYMSLSNCKLNEMEVQESLKQLKHCEARLHDIPAVYLKAENLAKTFMRIFNQSLRQGLFPSKWKIF